MNLVPLSKENLDQLLEPSLALVDQGAAFFFYFPQKSLLKGKSLKELCRENLIRLLQKESCVGFLAQRSNNLAGVLLFGPKINNVGLGAVITKDDLFKEETSSLKAFYIKEEFRNAGLGTALIKAWEHWAYSNFYRYLEIYLSVENDRSFLMETFIAKKGFSLIDIRYDNQNNGLKIFRQDLLRGKKGQWRLIWEEDSVGVQVIKSFLESHDIPTMLESNVVSSIHPFTLGPLGEVKVLVPAEMALKARKLLLQTQKDLNNPQNS